MPYKPMVKAPLVALSKTLKHFPPHDTLDNDEMAGGQTAFAALMYQEGMKANAWMLVGMWALGIGAPRVIKYLDEREQRAAEKAKVITGEELSRKLAVEQERNRQPTNPQPSPQPNTTARPANGVAAGGSAHAEPPAEKKPLTAEQVVGLIDFPGDKN